MALAFRVRAADLLVAGKGKIGELRELTFSIKTQGERVNTSAGTVKSRGAVITDIDFTTVVPVNGLRFDLFKQTIDQNELTVMVPFNGKTYAVAGTFDEATVKSVVQSGMTTGDFKFGAAEPVEVG